MCLYNCWLYMLECRYNNAVYNVTSVEMIVIALHSESKQKISWYVNYEIRELNLQPCRAAVWLISIGQTAIRHKFTAKVQTLTYSQHYKFCAKPILKSACHRVLAEQKKRSRGNYGNQGHAMHVSRPSCVHGR